MKTYVDWAIKQGFAVIDVNLPKHVTGFEDDDQEHEDNDSVENRTRQATHLLNYLWDNYVELGDATHIFLMGTNIGHGAIVNFIKAHEEQAQRVITEAISFVADVTLMSCKSATNDLLPGWYYQHSMVFVSRAHHFWDSEFVRKPKKRFGHMFKSEAADISDMLIESKDSVFETFLEDTEEWRAQNTPGDDDMGGVAETSQSSPNRMPSVANFALSPAPKTMAAGNSTGMSSSTISATAGNRSPTKLPTISNFAQSPRR